MIDCSCTSAPPSAHVNLMLRALSDARPRVGPYKPEPVGPPEDTKAIEGKSELTEDERREVEKLKQGDAEVRRHEAAHKGAAGQYASGGPSFEYTRGPDGKQYASGGEVQIDTSEVPGDPQATIRKMQQIRRAASAPAEPSSQDRRVSAQASQLEAKARAERADQKQAKGDGQSSVTESPSPVSQANAQPSESQGNVFAALIQQFIQANPTQAPGRFINAVA